MTLKSAPKSPSSPTVQPNVCEEGLAEQEYSEDKVVVVFEN